MVLPVGLVCQNLTTGRVPDDVTLIKFTTVSFASSFHDAMWSEILPNR
jgi:hypothetical protein